MYTCMHASSRLAVRFVYHCYTNVQLHVARALHISMSIHKVALGVINDQ